MVKSVVDMISSRFPSYAVCNPAVLAILKSPSFIARFPSNPVCNPAVLAKVKSSS
jgi:hypothetical protein